MKLPTGWYPLDYAHAPVICPITDRVLPSDPTDLGPVVEWRRSLLEAAKDDRELQRLIWQTCRDDWGFFANLCVWTPAGTKFLENGVQVQQDLKPTVWRNWPINDALHRTFRECGATGQAMMVPKSRDMRATLHFLIEFVHMFLFRPKWYGLMLANKEDLIDGAGPEGLIPRCRTILRYLPAWMTHDRGGARIWRSKHCLLENFENSAFIGGTATTAEPATGMRPTTLLFDEAAKNTKFQEGWSSSADSTKWRVAVSTYNGPEYFSKLDTMGIEVFGIGYWNHPDKGRGREIRTNQKPEFPVKVGKKFVWTPWFQNEVWDAKRQARRRDQVYVAQDLLVDKTAGSAGFFDGDLMLRLLERSRKRRPVVVGGLVRNVEPGPERDAAIIKRHPTPFTVARGLGESFKWWLDLNDTRPDQSHTYVVFADISQGKGASNSVAAIGSLELSRVVGMYAVSEFEPSEFFRQCIELCHWLGGRGNVARLGWERNGAGEGLDQVARTLRFNHLWSHDGKEPGWRSGGPEKIAAANALRSALETETLQVDDPSFYAEADDWGFITSTTIGAKRTAKDPDARMTHGDRVVAVMGLNLMIQSMPKPKPKSIDQHVSMDEWAKHLRKLRRTA